MTGNSFRSAIIARKGRTLLEGTGPERGFEALLRYMGRPVRRGEPVYELNPADGVTYEIRPDYDVGQGVLVHVDGHPSHWTRRGVAKGDWMDGVLNARGKRNLRLPGAMLEGGDEHLLECGWLLLAFLSDEGLPNYRYWP